jgi:hypothetical protein
VSRVAETVVVNQHHRFDVLFAWSTATHKTLIAMAYIEFGFVLASYLFTWPNFLALCCEIWRNMGSGISLKEIEEKKEN